MMMPVWSNHGAPPVPNVNMAAENCVDMLPRPGA